MDARELEALSMLTRGFTELKDANPELSYKLILDILSGIHECVFFSYLSLCARSHTLSSVIHRWPSMSRQRDHYSLTNVSLARAR